MSPARSRRLPIRAAIVCTSLRSSPALDAATGSKRVRDEKGNELAAVIADSTGIPEAIKEDILIAPFNDADAVESFVNENRDSIAAVFVEPLQRLIPPRPGFLEAMRELTLANDVLLVFDEVVTGFRMAYGDAQEYYGVVPDLCTLGKAIGGGFPLSAIAGREDIMALFDRDRVESDRFVPQVGTLSGNPVAATTGLGGLEPQVSALLVNANRNQERYAELGRCDVVADQ